MIIWSLFSSQCLDHFLTCGQTTDTTAHRLKSDHHSDRPKTGALSNPQQHLPRTTLGQKRSEFRRLLGNSTRRGNRCGATAEGWPMGKKPQAEFRRRPGNITCRDHGYGPTAHSPFPPAANQFINAELKRAWIPNATCLLNLDLLIFRSLTGQGTQIPRPLE